MCKLPSAIVIKLKFSDKIPESAVPPPQKWKSKVKKIDPLRREFKRIATGQVFHPPLKVKLFLH